MKFRIFLLTIFVLLSACEGLDLFIKKEGEFPKDQELVDMFQKYPEDFESIINSKGLCDKDNVNELDDISSKYCEGIKQKLKISRIEYSLHELSIDGDTREETVLEVYRVENHAGNDGKLVDYYTKGYFFSSDSTLKKNLWDGNLDADPGTHGCDNYYRSIELDQSGMYPNWSLFAYANCI